jgi:hypothetical protein
MTRIRFSSRPSTPPEARVRRGSCLPALRELSCRQKFRSSLPILILVAAALALRASATAHGTSVASGTLLDKHVLQRSLHAAFTHRYAAPLVPRARDRREVMADGEGIVKNHAGQNTRGGIPRGALHSKARALYALLPLDFERNDGQTDPKVRFLARGPGYTVFLTRDGAVLRLQRISQRSLRRGTPWRASKVSVVRLTLVGASSDVPVKGENQLPGKSNYFLGNDPRHWHTGIPTYSQVRYRGIYPGVDLAYYGRPGQLENDFILAAGADPRRILIHVTGAKRLVLDTSGALVLQTRTGEARLDRPAAYQGSGAKRRWLNVRYVRRGPDEVGLEVHDYQPSQPLIIDPVLTYSTYLGGTGGDMAYGVTVDSSGDAYVTGSTGSTNFPVKSAVQSSPGGDGDAFVAELNPAGSALLYSTYLGGSGVDVGQGIAVDPSGAAYVIGTTSGGFPVTTGAFQTTYGGGNSNAFVAKLGPGGTKLDYVTYLGGNAADFGLAIAIDGSGDAFVTGSTSSPNFPVLPNPGAFQVGNDGCITAGTTTTCTADAFVTELNPTGTGLVYSTYLGGSAADSGQAIAVDSQGYCYVGGYTNSTDFPTQAPLQSSSGGGSDGFITELKPGGQAVVFSTYWGGSGNDEILGLALDSQGSIYVTGQTQSDDFPTAGNTYQASYGGNGDAFLSKFASPDKSGQNGSTKVYSTYLGGSQADQGNGVAVDSSGDAIVVGYTQSSDFPSLDPMQTIPGISGAGTCGTVTCSDAFITKFGPSGAPVYSTYLGGSQNDAAQAVALDSSGTPYIAGSTDSPNFPVISGAIQSVYAGSGTSGNAFVAKVDPSDAPGVALTPQSVNFGNQTVGQATTTPQTVTLINEGSAPLEISGISASGAFSETNNCGTTITPGGGTCNIYVTFTPSVTGSTTNQIEISDNAAGSPQYITVTGNGVTGGAGTLTLTPSTLTFPSEPVGSTSPSQTVQIINTSQSSVTITAFNLSGQFVETNNCGATPVVLNAGAGCMATIYFAPTSGGSQTGSFSVTSNAAGSASVSLTGSGSALFSLSAPTISTTIVAGITQTTFTIGASAPPTFTSNISLSCSSSVTCSFNPTSIKPGQTSTVTVTKLSAATNPTNFTVTGTASSQTVTLSLSVFFSDFSISALPTVGQVTAGNSTSFTVTASPENGFNQVVLLSCSSGLPANSTCTWSPPGVDLNGVPSAASTLTIDTTSQISNSGALRFPRTPRPPGGWPGSGRLWVIWAGFVLLAAGMLAGYRNSPSKGRRQARWLLAGAGVLLVTMSAVGCNDLYYRNNINPAPVGTPSGVFKITLTGTLGSNANVTRATTVNLSVGPSP